MKINIPPEKRVLQNEVVLAGGKSFHVDIKRFMGFFSRGVIIIIIYKNIITSMVHVLCSLDPYTWHPFVILCLLLFVNCCNARDCLLCLPC